MLLHGKACDAGGVVRPGILASCMPPCVETGWLRGENRLKRVVIDPPNPFQRVFRIQAWDSSHADGRERHRVREIWDWGFAGVGIVRWDSCQLEARVGNCIVGFVWIDAVCETFGRLEKAQFGSRIVSLPKVGRVDD